MRVTEHRQIFLRPDMSLYAAENSDHIQPQVVLCREYNAIMRIYTKIQPTLKYTAYFVRVIKCRQFFCAPDIFLYMSENSGLIQP